MGRFNGLFFSIFRVSNVVMSALAGVLIERFSKSIFYLIMASLALVSTFMFLCILEPIDV